MWCSEPGGGVVVAAGKSWSDIAQKSPKSRQLSEFPHAAFFQSRATIDVRVGFRLNSTLGTVNTVFCVPTK